MAVFLLSTLIVGAVFLLLSIGVICHKRTPLKSCGGARNIGLDGRPAQCASCAQSGEGRGDACGRDDTQ